MDTRSRLLIRSPVAQVLATDSLTYAHTHKKNTNTDSSISVWTARLTNQTVATDQPWSVCEVYTAGSREQERKIKQWRFDDILIQ